ncbi:capsid assembly protein [Bordetella phage vB_BbrP_BB8]|uniref:Capsid assembly protein n=1 Tax=Bordetella phage vB_BbrP_BB8 TaxID=2587820 RepID=A0A4Y5TNS8_9CAUD|nr:capsid assembly protein [Bordetella phage vB_BbrP_BB8]
MVDTVVIQSGAEPVKEDQAHIDAMIAKVDGANAAASTVDQPDAITEKAEKPEWVPEKFWDEEKGEVRTEALAQSYKELESKQGAAKKEEPAKEPEKAPEGDPAKATQDDAAKELATKGLNLDDFNAEFQRDGGLSDESYKKLEEAGYPRSYVDTYIAGQKALATQFQSEVKSVAGGDEGFAAMVEWAAANADPKDVAAYNRAIDSGDVDAAKLAVAGMYQKFQEARPDEPSLLAGAGGKVTADVYESRAQMVADMSDPRYKADPAFRKKVIDKVARSDIL